ncbi:protein disulfide-isomerase domain protein [Teladorsagia circumcincta]|uniref:Protein disulfide-isomerase domain protein n=1 Tax=Teladorsagia circumcincta TaxID=45464 RepID=A0A2G9UML3_TELCI|nr:protein disulfide-isomerase domain protein [Teladorsagia circumcincta]
MALSYALRIWVIFHVWLLADSEKMKFLRVLSLLLLCAFFTCSLTEKKYDDCASALESAMKTLNDPDLANNVPTEIICEKLNLFGDGILEMSNALDGALKEYKNMFRLLTTLLFLLGVASGDEEFKKEDGIYVLTNKTFDDFVKANPTFLAEFSSPKCHHCREFAPVYAKIASQVNIPSVKIDVGVEKELEERYQIEAMPAIKLWQNGEGPENYYGDTELEEIVEWVLTRTDPNFKPPPSAVITLTSANFTEYLAEQALCLVEFHAPWCCEELNYHIEKAARKLKDEGSPIKLAKVDAEAEKELARKYVVGFPTLVVMRHGRRSEYKGSEDAARIFDIMKELAIPAVKKLANASLVEGFMEKEDVTIKFQNIGYTTDTKTFKKFDAKPDDVIIFYPTMFQSKFEPKSRKFNKADATPEELAFFIHEHCTPLVGKRTRKNVATRYNKFPLVVVYYNVDFSLQYREGSDYWRQKVLNVAQKYQKEGYRFAVSDEEEFEEELQAAGLGRFADCKIGFAQGALVVGDESKDVVVELYSPQCHICQTFEPIYKEMANKFKKTQPNLIFTKFDATVNEVPVEFSITSYPTIFFVPSGKKSTPIKYGGNREEKDLIAFMELHAVKSFQKKEKEEL